MNRNIIVAIVFFVAFVLLLGLTDCSNSDKRRAAEIALKETSGAHVSQIEEDSCYSVYHRIEPLLQEAKQTQLYDTYKELHDIFYGLSTQVEDPQNDHGGIKVKCFKVTCRFDTGNDYDVVVMVMPDRELVTIDEERLAWLQAAGEMDKLARKFVTGY